jgi:hypothetical protein
MGALISPVKAPESSQKTFWEPTLTGDFLNESAKAWM